MEEGHSLGLFFGEFSCGILGCSVISKDILGLFHGWFLEGRKLRRVMKMVSKCLKKPGSEGRMAMGNRSQNNGGVVKHGSKIPHGSRWRCCWYKQKMDFYCHVWWLETAKNGEHQKTMEILETSRRFSKDSWSSSHLFLVHTPCLLFGSVPDLWSLLPGNQVESHRKKIKVVLESATTPPKTGDFLWFQINIPCLGLKNGNMMVQPPVITSLEQMSFSPQAKSPFLWVFLSHGSCLWQGFQHSSCIPIFSAYDWGRTRRYCTVCHSSRCRSWPSPGIVTASTSRWYPSWRIVSRKSGIV